MEYFGTLGPACAHVETLKQMIKAGMTGVRLNLSHRSLRESESLIKTYFKAAKECEIYPDFMIDLMGPEIRVGAMSGMMVLKKGQEVTVGDGQIPVQKEILPYFKKGQEILIDDGKLELEVIEEQKDGKCRCRVLCGGPLSSRKGITLPGCQVERPTLTQKDLENLNFAEEYGVTDVMLPFVRGKEDLLDLRTALDQNGYKNIRIFAKIENMQGVEHLQEILPFCDYIVIARGDLGNAVPYHKLPRLQAEIARRCQKYGRKFMVVTQMLHSMIEHPYPTRAEVNDIFHAIEQGADAVMLTGETAAGKYPAEAIKMLVDTGKEAEDYLKELES